MTKTAPAQYFYIPSHCRLVKGEQRYAIYDLQNSILYSIDKKFGDAVHLLSTSNISINNAARILNINDIPPLIKGLQKLANIGIGLLSKNRLFIDYSTMAIQAKDFKNSPKPIPIQKATLQITTQCSLSCIHCSQTSQRFALCVCNRYNAGGNNEFSFTGWAGLISELDLLGCQELQITGGDPLLVRDKTKHIIRELNKSNIPRKVIFTPGQRMNETWLTFLKDMNMIWRFKVYALNAATHDKITQHKGSYSKLIKWVEKANKIGLPVEAHMEELTTDEGEFDRAASYFLQEYNIELTKTPHQQLAKEYTKDCRSTATGVNPHIFYRNKDGHSCWHQKITISPEGNLIPCLSCNEYVVGSLKDNTIIQYMKSGEIQHYWRENRDHTQGCNDCELKYGCFYCPVLFNAPNSN